MAETIILSNPFYIFISNNCNLSILVLDTGLISNIVPHYTKASLAYLVMQKNNCIVHWGRLASGIVFNLIMHVVISDVCGYLREL